VRRLIDAVSDVCVLSRRPPEEGPRDPEWVTGDLRTGAGLGRAVRGVAAIIHCATDVRSPRCDVEATRNLIEAARVSGVPHLVYVSIVGVDRVPQRYYRVKLRVETLVEGSGLPWTILRANQFHDLVLYASQALARLPVMVVPAGTSLQPIDADEVAARMVELAADPPGGRVPDLGGPRVYAVAELARAYLRASGRRRLVLPVRLPGKAARCYRQGGHLTPDHADGGRSYEEFLAECERARESGDAIAARRRGPAGPP
jgi:uncharacterized protein YbjT (DUF2867 family)